MINNASRTCVNFCPRDMFHTTVGTMRTCEMSCPSHMAVQESDEYGRRCCKRCGELDRFITKDNTCTLDCSSGFGVRTKTNNYCLDSCNSTYPYIFKETNTSFTMCSKDCSEYFQLVDT
jgi:hypothetical protein